MFCNKDGVGCLSNPDAKEIAGGTRYCQMLRIFFSNFLATCLSEHLKTNSLRPGNTLSSALLFVSPSESWQYFKANFLKNLDFSLHVSRRTAWGTKLDVWEKKRRDSVKELKLLPTFITSHRAGFELQKKAYEELVRMASTTTIVGVSITSNVATVTHHSNK